MSKKDYSDWTQVIESTSKSDPNTGAINTPLQLSSTFVQKDLDDFGKWDYTRSGNPTRDVLEESIAQLEHGKRGFAFSTGMAAISTSLLTLNQGDHIIVPEEVYGGTFRLVTQILPKYGIDYSFVDFSDIDAVKNAFKKNTKVVYVETPANPTLNVTDIQKIAKIAHQKNALLFADNTFMTPIWQKPLDLGADLVVHSGTKFLAGHSDVLAGLVVTKNDDLGDQVYFLQNSMGATLGVSDCWLLMRGIKTLAVRMEKESENAQTLADWLKQQSIVTHVNYPNEDNLNINDVHSGGAVLSFDIGSEDNVRKFIKEVKIPKFSVSLGAVESILSYPPLMSHAEMSPSERHSRGITDGLLRLSVGLESVDDIKADFKQAFDKIDN